MRRDWCVLAGICLSFGLSAVAAQTPTVPSGQQPPQQQRERTRPPAEQTAASGEGTQGKQEKRPAVPEEKSSVTHHSARIGGQTINYTATAATYNIKADDGTVKATMFYVAYVKDGVADPAKRFAGNNLACSDCHLEAGTKKFGLPVFGLYGDFPQWNRRAHRVIALQDRIAECFLYSMNGRPPAYDSKAMIAIVAYISWLSRGVPVGRSQSPKASRSRPCWVES